MTANLEPATYQQVSFVMSDGTLLTGRLWLPEGSRRCPLVLEWIPYRHSDNTAIGDSMLYGFFAANGIAALRVDLRGSGNSQGLLHDEYLVQEQDAGSTQRLDWPLDACLSKLGHARAGHRLSRRMRALVEALAGRRRKRNHERANAATLAG